MLATWFLTVPSAVWRASPTSRLSPLAEALRGGHRRLADFLVEKGAAGESAGKPRTVFLVRHAEVDHVFTSRGRPLPELHL
jgi:hypothetical protein